ncbi:unnamed protein product [Ectocarpus sp. CCAP 1310/34]|nr:unnamed protein product [Ectocarpus sp. CCAP 1310/34]
MNNILLLLAAKIGCTAHIPEYTFKNQPLPLTKMNI